MSDIEPNQRTKQNPKGQRSQNRAENSADSLPTHVSEKRGLWSIPGPSLFGFRGVRCGSVWGAWGTWGL